MRIDVKFFESCERIEAHLNENEQKIEANLNENEQKIKAGFSSYQEATVLKDMEPYAGSYQITPSPDAQILYTAQKRMTEDMTINGIPYFETSNEYHGKTVYIGSEAELYGN